MRKKLFAALAVAVVAVVAGYNVYSLQKSTTLSDLALANVEALASDESTTVDCPRGSTECARVIVGNTVHIFYKN